MARNDKSIPHRFPCHIPYLSRLTSLLVLASRRSSRPRYLSSRLTSRSLVLLLRLVFISSFPFPIVPPHRLIAFSLSPLWSYPYRPTPSSNEENELRKTARPSYRRTARQPRPRHRPLRYPRRGNGRGEHAATSMRKTNRRHHVHETQRAKQRNENRKERSRGTERIRAAETNRLGGTRIRTA